MSFPMVRLEAEHLAQAYTFSSKVAAWTVAKEFGDATTAPRLWNEIQSDVFIGKLGELGFQILMERNYGLEVKLDWEVYRSRGRGDACDCRIGSRLLDVKTTKPTNRFLMVNTNQRKAEARRGVAPDLYVLCRIHGFERGVLLNPNVEVVGFFEADKLTGRRIHQRGCPIPGTATPLQTDNWVIRVDELNQAFETLGSEGGRQ
jgi:hypothetical protein